MGAGALILTLALIPLLLTGGAALFESVSAFSEAPNLWRYCKRPLVLGSLLFGLWGVGWYVVLLLLKISPLQPQFASQAPPDVSLAFAAFIAAQTGRIEAARTTHMHGTPQIPGDKESYYSKGLRMLQVAVYHRLVDHMPENEVRLLVRRGLIAAYDVHTMMGEYRTWALNLPDVARAHQLNDWSKSVLGSQTQTEPEKLELLVQSMIRDDLGMAKALAKRRGPTIVYQRAI